MTLPNVQADYLPLGMDAIQNPFARNHRRELDSRPELDCTQ